MIKELKYLVIYEQRWSDGSPTDMTIPDGADVDLDSPLSWLEGVCENVVESAVHVLNLSDYWRGWFWYNDMEEAEDAGPIEVNSREHLDAYWETNNSGGHYDCNKYEHIVNGNIIESFNPYEQESECN